MNDSFKLKMWLADSRGPQAVTVLKQKSNGCSLVEKDGQQFYCDSGKLFSDRRGAKAESDSLKILGK